MTETSITLEKCINCISAIEQTISDGPTNSDTAMRQAISNGKKICDLMDRHIIDQRRPGWFGCIIFDNDIACDRFKRG